MANSVTISRPYAKAILSLARSTNGYAQWSEMLEFLSMVVVDSRVKLLIENKVLGATKKAEFINTVDPDRLTTQGQNLVKVLAYNDRLEILPELYNLYESMRKLEQRQVSLQLVLAQATDATAIEELQNIFSDKLKAQITVQSDIDASLIAGGRLKIGGRVLDLNIKSSLQDLYKHLTQ